MSVATADLSKAINTTWDASGLNTTFTDLWAGSLTQFVVLNDQEAPGGQPFPYVVLDPFTPVTVFRMSSQEAELREVRDVEVIFNVHAKQISGDPRTAKEIAAFLAEEILKVFGGHPKVSPTGTVTLDDNAHHLITTYQIDVGLRTGEDEYQWRIVYIFKVDVTVAV